MISGVGWAIPVKLSRHIGKDLRQAILPEALRVNANLFQTDLCRYSGTMGELHPCNLDSGNPCRNDVICSCCAWVED